MTMGELIALQHDRQPSIQPIPAACQCLAGFQQVQISVERLGDILNAPPEFRPQGRSNLPPPRWTDRIPQRHPFAIVRARLTP